MKKLLLAGVAALSVLSASAAEAADGQTALACQGTITSDKMLYDEKPEIISMGIVVDLTKGTVQGDFGFGQSSMYGLGGAIPITEWNDASISFDGKVTVHAGAYMERQDHVWGTIDRVTGDVEATKHVFYPKAIEPKTKTNAISLVSYTLKCKPK